MIDMSKEYQTREGKPVRIYAVDGGGIYPVHGAIMDEGYWHSQKWTKSGETSAFLQYEDPMFFDQRGLVEKPQTVTRWMNVHGDSRDVQVGVCFEGRGSADSVAAEARIGVIRIEVTGNKYEVFKEEL